MIADVISGSFQTDAYRHRRYQVLTLCTLYTNKGRFSLFGRLTNQIFTIKRQNSINAALTRSFNFKILKLYSYAKQTLKTNFSYLSGSCNVNNDALRAAENCYGKDS